MVKLDKCPHLAKELKELAFTNHRTILQSAFPWYEKQSDELPVCQAHILQDFCPKQYIRFMIIVGIGAEGGWYIYSISASLQARITGKVSGELAVGQVFYNTQGQFPNRDQMIDEVSQLVRALKIVKPYRMTVFEE